jgi:hypothetical protein
MLRRTYEAEAVAAKNRDIQLQRRRREKPHRSKKPTERDCATARLVRNVEAHIG